MNHNLSGEGPSPQAPGESQTDKASNIANEQATVLEHQKIDKEKTDTQKAQELIDSGHFHDLATSLQFYESLDSSFAGQLIEAGYGGYVANNLDKFEGLNASIAEQLIKTDEYYALAIIHNLDKFDHAEQILLSMLENISSSEDLTDAVLEHLSLVKFDPDDLYKVLLACSQNYSTAQKVKKLQLTDMGLNETKASELLTFINNLKPELKDVSKGNPYADTAGSIEYVTITIPGQEVHFEASKISRLLADETSIYRTLGDIVDEKVGELLRQVDFQEQINSTNTREKYMIRLFKSTYRHLAAEFLALWLSEQLGLDYEKLDYEEIQKLETGLREVLTEANLKYLEVLDTDIPYYDKIFNEWDTKRIGEKEFQEVFLGRDGVYAFIGRRAQIDARRRMLGFDDRQEHEIIYPTYLVYPRYFRDSLSETTKSVYLSQHIKNPKSAHYFDTGFTGTIPQDIMRVMGISEEDWDRRIRLLTAQTRERTVIGLKGSKDERDEIVSDVEHNVKDESSAEALYETTTGRIEPIAKPRSPRERLSFALIQMALHRHYYLAEINKSQKEEDRFVSTRIRPGELRISQSLSKEQREALLTFLDTDKIGKKLVDETQTIKVAEPESPYPDEAVFELELEGTDGIIIKSVVIDKQHGPLDEFEALLLLKRLGIDAPKPLARLFTKEQHGFIVIDKLPGVSGRTIKDYFIRENIDLDAQKRVLQELRERMTEIAETVRQDAGLDKPWRLKDFMIVFGKSESGEVTIERMLPIDFERAEVFDPFKARSIQLGQELDKIIDGLGL